MLFLASFELGLGSVLSVTLALTILRPGPNGPTKNLIVISRKGTNCRGKMYVVQVVQKYCEFRVAFIS